MRAAEDLMRAAAARGARAHVAFFEVYRGQVLDLLGQRARVQQHAHGALSLMPQRTAPGLSGAVVSPGSWLRHALGTGRCAAQGPVGGYGAAVGTGRPALPICGFHHHPG